MFSKIVLSLSCLALIPLAAHARHAHVHGSGGGAQAALQHPVIIGASVSSGFVTTSPGDLAAARYTSPQNITNIAQAGASGKDFTQVSPNWAAQYTSILAVDFLFWDSTLTDVNASVQALHNLVYSAAQAHVPLVLGDIPALKPEQVSRTILNQYIHASCHPSQQCYIVGLDRLHQVSSTRGVVIGGQLYHYQDLTADGLHVNATGSAYIASLIVGLLSRR